MRLAIEPPHPMYAADRACVNTLAHANALCDEIAPDGADGLGIAVDVYHVWWDPELQREIRDRNTFICPDCGLAELAGPFSALTGSYYECPACQHHVKARDLPR
jgi:hypothetical protein